MFGVPIDRKGNAENARTENAGKDEEETSTIE